MDIRERFGKIYGFAMLDFVFTFVFSIIFVFYSYENPKWYYYLSYFVFAIILSVPIHIVTGQDTRLVRLLTT